MGLKGATVHIPGTSVTQLETSVPCSLRAHRSSQRRDLGFRTEPAHEGSTCPTRATRAPQTSGSPLGARGRELSSQEGGHGARVSEGLGRRVSGPPLRKGVQEPGSRGRGGSGYPWTSHTETDGAVVIGTITLIVGTATTIMRTHWGEPRAGGWSC